jgi:hypothetical protein
MNLPAGPASAPELRHSSLIVSYVRCWLADTAFSIYILLTITEAR